MYPDSGYLRMYPDGGYLCTCLDGVYLGHVRTVVVSRWTLPHTPLMLPCLALLLVTPQPLLSPPPLHGFPPSSLPLTSPPS